jgi:hypothetical protein
MDYFHLFDTLKYLFLLLYKISDQLTDGSFKLVIETILRFVIFEIQLDWIGLLVVELHSCTRATIGA